MAKKENNSLLHLVGSEFNKILTLIAILNTYNQIVPSTHLPSFLVLNKYCNMFAWREPVTELKLVPVLCITHS